MTFLGRLLRKRVVLFLIFLTFLVPGIKPVSAVNVTGTISTNTTWNTSGTPYVMTGNVTVASGVTLTIDGTAGLVEVRSGGNYRLTVNTGGTLIVTGTSANPVRFTHNTSTSLGAWGGVRVASGGTATVNYARMTYSSTSFMADGGTLVVNDSVLESNTNGLVVASTGNITTARNTFIKNTYPISLEWESTYSFGTGADADILGTDTNKNTYNVLAVGNYDPYGNNCPANVCTISQRTFAGIANIPYQVVPTTYFLDSADDLYIFDAGVIIKVASRLHFRQATRVQFNSSSGNNVIFTSIHDDTVGGDSNNNGTATSPAAGNWYGIVVQSSQAQTYSFCTIKYSIYGIYANAATANVLIADSLFDRNNDAISATNGATIQTARNTFTRNDFAITVDWEATYNFGSGADVDILGTGAEINKYHAIGVGNQDANVSDCPSNNCVVQKKNFAGITNIPYYQTSTYYYINGNDDTTTIEPGVIIKSSGRMYIRGTSQLVAQGTVGEPIYFTSYRDDSIGGDSNNDSTTTTPAAGNWIGVIFENSVNQTFSNCVMRYAEYGITASGNTGLVTIQDNLFESNTYAVNAYNRALISTARNTFKKNVYPIGMDWEAQVTFGQGANTDILGSGADKNTYKAISVGAYDNNNTDCIANQCTISQLTFAGISNIDYVLDPFIYYFNSADDVITFDPGVVIKMEGRVQVSNAVVFNFNGTSGSPVYFTSPHDDTVGGDIAENGSATVPARGDWYAWIFLGTTAVSFDNCVVKYGNVSVISGAASAVVYVTDNVFENNIYPVSANNNGIIHTARNVFRKNQAPVSLEWDSTLVPGTDSNADILGTGIDANDFNAIKVGAHDKNATNCPANTCTVSQLTFGGIQNIPYYATNEIVFEGTDDTLVFSPGVIMKFDGGSVTVRSGAKISIAGTSAGRVVFTSARDDSVGGDTNNNGSTNAPAKADWNSLNLQSGANSVAFVEVRYSRDGIYATGGTLSVSDADLTTNTNGMWVVLSASPTLARINFQGNTTGLRNGNSTIIQAQNLWWNSVNGPNDTSSTGQCPLNVSTGDAVIDTSTNPVLYCPFAVTKFNANSLPSAADTLIDGGNIVVNLTESTTTSVTCTTNVIDADGYTDIAGVNAILYRTSLGDSGSNNDNYRYSVACSAGSGSGTLRAYSCNFTVWFHADPTDASSANSGDDWTCKVSPYDAGGVGVTDTDTIEMGSVIGIEVSSHINYGNLNGGDNTGSTNITSAIANSGNVAIDIEMYGQDMCTDFPTCAAGVIPVTRQQYNTSSFSYGAGTALTASPVFIPLNIAKSTAHPPNLSSTLYWGLGIPAGAQMGAYTGQNTFTALLH